ncbi:MAG: hypothetical protein JEZ07_12660 [Phycisphaerae bacterium]|nr:hypothetical protein [Phycisphaerae bacterium]
MKCMKCYLVLTMLVAMGAGQLYAQQDRSARQGTAARQGNYIFGEWQVSMKYGDRTMESILVFSRDQERNLNGQWISSRGITDLKDVKFEEAKLTFTQERQGRDGNTSTSKFSGAVKEGVLTGTLTSERGDTELTGKRAPRTSRAVGSWEMNFKIGDREMTNTMTIKAGKPEKPGQPAPLTAEWKSTRAESKISDLKYERGKLTFKRTIKMEDQEFTIDFEGQTAQDGTLTGTMKSERGDIEVTGKLIGAELIGNWALELKSEDRPARKQRLKVNSDMTGLYGSLPIEKITLEKEKVTFKATMKFGEREYTMDFTGKLDKGKLTGEMKTSRDTQKVTGTKIIRAPRTRTTRNQ